MKILIVGSTGSVGTGVFNLLKNEAEVITANRSSGDVQVDLMDESSIKSMFEQVGKVDAIISTAGLPIVFKPLVEMTAEDYLTSFQSKALGQIRLALIGKDYLNDGGSISLTSGYLTENFIKAGSAGTVINSAIDGFVKAAAFELPRGIRINAISPGLLANSVEKYGAFFPGAEVVTGDQIARAFQRSVFGIMSGQVFLVI